MLKNTALSVAMMLVVTGAVASASTVFQDNFENDVVSPGYDGTPGVITGTQFTLVAGSIDINGPTYYPTLCTSVGQSYCLDTQGGFGLGNTVLGEIETTNQISLAPGSYVLSFNMQGWSCNATDCPPGGDNEGPATVNVTLGTLINQDITMSGASDPYPITNIPFTVSSPTLAYLVFNTTSGSATYAGNILDDISINTTTPEPGSVMLVGLGIAALAAARRRFAAR